MRLGNKIKVAKPLFPRYIFVSIRQQWSSLTGTYGVSGVVMDSKGPRKVPDKIVSALVEREDKDGFVVLDEVGRLREGQQIRVGSGLLGDRIGIYQGMDADARAIVLFRLLGSERAFKVDPKVLVVV